MSGLIIRAQEEEKNWTLNGYVKELASFNFSDDSLVVDNLIHNRLNFKWYPNDNLDIKLEIRNRLFSGETVKSLPNYGQFVDVNNDYLDLSVMSEGESWVAHSMIDRAYIEWHKNDWEVRVGRQRVNWGVNVVWNPNDIFNVYSFTDFDYEERPGSDAIKIKKYTGVASSLEIASNVAATFDEMVMAGMWNWNKKSYDYQVLLGKAGEDLVVGIGWAGNIKNAGFKGEFTYFNPYADESINESALVGSMAFDYSFESSLYLNGSLLFNSAGSNDPSLLESLQLFSQDRLTVRNLSAFKYSVFTQASYPFTPLVSGGVAVIMNPGERNAMFINPSVSVSLRKNLDINLVSQLYYDKFSGPYEAQAKVIFVRLKWSF